MMLSTAVVVDEAPSSFTITIPEVGIVNVCEKKVHELTDTLPTVPIIVLFIKILIEFALSIDLV